jgi:peptidoglycan/LPS O-acetylase OafA/YrhL
MLLAEVHSSYSPGFLTRIPPPIPFLTMLAGAFLGSFPQNNPSWAPWSHKMHYILFAHIPTETHHEHALPIEKLSEIDLRRYWHSIGACIFIVGCAGSSITQRLLKTRFFQFLGAVSLPVYLLHNQLVKTLFVWLVYLPGDETQIEPETGLLRPAGGVTRFWIAVPMFLGMLYTAAWLWTKYVDPLCDKVTKRFLDAVWVGPASPMPLGPLRSPSTRRRQS